MSKIYRTRSRITGKKFNRQDPSVRRHGPMKKRQVYKYAIEKTLNENQDKWLTAEEIAWKANEYISPFWTQLSRFSVGAILRVYIKEGSLKSNRPLSSQAKRYKATKLYTIPEKSGLK